MLKPSDLELADVYGNTLLYYACLCGHLQLVHFLSEKGARDDKFHRCYMNALSLNIRKLLKIYNNYSNFSNNLIMKKKEDLLDEEDHLLQMESLSLQSFMVKKTKRILLESERNMESDITLTIRFSDQPQETNYYCHLWILLARWPLLLYFALVQESRPIPWTVANSLSYHEQTLITLKIQ
ncbi:hypothetical protein FDP41_006031 [Naegleria fowleri]|uniref:Uncharacterized protein n=1 Tax=Naegleria fowleri TaxID=5763 RepID=A0A6A5BJC6_NAEFO|nr:uncharacterized protein FDP41_006031 [Naegleria fowleri]KAF0974926.1 hypothetical protein FDP41_006031 [Naegleria fowleri]